MKVAIRMISIATALFWIFLIAFTVSAVYSFIKDVRFSFGEIQMPTSLTEENEMVISVPITIENMGLFNIGFFNVTTEISDIDGLIITRGNTCIPIINRNTAITVNHNVTVNVTDLFQKSSTFIFNDTTLVLYEAVGMSVAEIIPFTASTNITIPWGAPLYNLNLGEPEYLAVNRTHTLIRIPVSFENHSFFDIAGNLIIRMYNSANTLVEEGQTTIEVPSNTIYSGYAEVYVKNTAIPSSGVFEISFQTPIFNFNLGEINFG
jgi:filamentous hemagglutinin family protein